MLMHHVNDGVIPPTLNYSIVILFDLGAQRSDHVLMIKESIPCWKHVFKYMYKGKILFSTKRRALLMMEEEEERRPASTWTHEFTVHGQMARYHAIHVISPEIWRFPLCLCDATIVHTISIPSNQAVDRTFVKKRVRLPRRYLQSHWNLYKTIGPVSTRVYFMVFNFADTEKENLRAKALSAFSAVFSPTSC